MKPIVVFDTNILISAVLSFTGKPFQCTALAKRGAIESVTCAEILAEFQEKLIAKLKFDPQRAESLIHEVLDYSKTVTLPRTLKVVSDDPDDEMVVECAVEGFATHIVTGDRHLLSLKAYQDIVILKASDFLSLFFQR